jgi:hypothetical protein
MRFALLLALLCVSCGATRYLWTAGGAAAGAATGAVVGGIPGAAVGGAVGGAGAHAIRESNELREGDITGSGARTREHELWRRLEKRGWLDETVKRWTTWAFLLMAGWVAFKLLGPRYRQYLWHSFKAFLRGRLGEGTKAFLVATGPAHSDGTTPAENPEMSPDLASRRAHAARRRARVTDLPSLLLLALPQTAIARWDAVPHAPASRVGVVAFHRSGIDRVEFSSGTVARELVSSGGAWEYVTSADPGELRATAYPRIGAPRELEPLPIALDVPGEVRYVSTAGDDTSGDGSQAAPYATIWRAARSMAVADGGRIRLLTGEYQLGPAGWPPVVTTDRWLTVEPVEGHEATITEVPHPGLDTRLLRLHGLLIRDPLTTGGPGHKLWLDGCTLRGNGQHTTLDSGAGWFPAGPGWGFDGGVWVTGCTFVEDRFGPINATLVRGTHLQDIGEDAFDSCGLIVNSSVDNLSAGPTDWHADVVEYDWTRGLHQENYIIYGLRATNIDAQGLYMDGHDHPGFRVDDVAFVNVLVHNTHGGAGSLWDEVANDHLLLWHVTILGQPLTWRSTGMTGLDVRGCLFQAMGLAPPGVFAHNHWIGSGATGFDATTGDPGLSGHAPHRASVLRGRLASPLPADLAGVQRPIRATVGALQ